MSTGKKAADAHILLRYRSRSIGHSRDLAPTGERFTTGRRTAREQNYLQSLGFSVE